MAQKKKKVINKSLVKNFEFQFFNQEISANLPQMVQNKNLALKMSNRNISFLVSRFSRDVCTNVHLYYFFSL